MLFHTNAAATPVTSSGAGFTAVTAMDAASLEACAAPSCRGGWEDHADQHFGLRDLDARIADDRVRVADRHAADIFRAGGTDLLPSMRQKLFQPEYLVDIRDIGELRGIRVLPSGDVAIGALTTLSEIEHSAVIAERYRALREAARTVASPVLRNMGTIDDNIWLDTRCLWYNQSLAWRTSCGFCIK